jgi:hypothetical protein
MSRIQQVIHLRSTDGEGATGFGHREKKLLNGSVWLVPYVLVDDH